jgi:peptidoglycan/LPS O-acetylase OafA/YrhL
MHVLRGVASFGWCGVNLFFVLSGFLITGILLDTKEAPNYFKSFYVRRILRIFPLYYLVLTTILLASSTPPGLKLIEFLPPSGDRWTYFVYLSNLRWWPGANIIGHFWSLAVEEQFYLIWPLLVWLIPTTAILPLGVAGMLFSLGLRVFMLSTHGDTVGALHGTFAKGMDALLAGACVACVVRRSDVVTRCKPWIYSLGVAGALGVAVVVALGRTFALSTWQACWFITFLSLVFGSLTYRAFVMAERPAMLQRTLRSRLLTSFGKFSYGIYVYHVPLLVISSHFLARRLRIGENTLSSLLYSLVL